MTKQIQPSVVTVLRTNEVLPLFVRKFTGKMIPCPGEAHDNAFIDHCGVCMPRWGVIQEREPKLDAAGLQAALAEGFAVSVNDIQDGIECKSQQVEVRTKAYTCNFHAVLPRK